MLFGMNVLQGLTFHLTNTPPLPEPCLDVDIGHYIITDR